MVRQFNTDDLLQKSLFHECKTFANIDLSKSHLSMDDDGVINCYILVSYEQASQIEILAICDKAPNGTLEDVFGQVVQSIKYGTLIYGFSKSSKEGYMFTRLNFTKDGEQYIFRWAK